jgi:hypothetical protein
MALDVLTGEEIIGPYNYRGATHRDVLSGLEIIRSPEVEPTDPLGAMGDAGRFLAKEGIGALDATLALGGGLVAWPMAKMWGGMNTLVGKALGEDPEIVSQVAEWSEEDIYSKFFQPGMLEDLAASEFPKVFGGPQYGRAASETVGRGIDLALSGPRTLANVEGDLYKGMGLKPIKETHPNAGYFAELATDLMTFKAAHSVGAKAKNMWNRRGQRIAKLSERPAATWTDDDVRFANDLGAKLRAAKEIGQGPQRLLEAPRDFFDAEFTVEITRQVPYSPRGLPMPQRQLIYKPREGGRFENLKRG